MKRPYHGHPERSAAKSKDPVNHRSTRSAAPTLWRSIEELENTPEFEEFLHREFPSGASEWPDDVSRRHFLKLMGASFALAGLNACVKQPLEKIVPYVKQ